MIMWTTQDGEQHHRTDDASRIQLKGLQRAGQGPVSVQVGRCEAQVLQRAGRGPVSVQVGRGEVQGLQRAGWGPVSVQVGRGEAHEIDWAVLSPYLCVFPNLPHCLPDKVPPPWEHTHCCPLPLFWKWNLPVYLFGSGGSWELKSG